jgi:hypothetical protein
LPAAGWGKPNAGHLDVRAGRSGWRGGRARNIGTEIEEMTVFDLKVVPSTRYTAQLCAAL